MIRKCHITDHTYRPTYNACNNITLSFIRKQQVHLIRNHMADHTILHDMIAHQYEYCSMCILSGNAITADHAMLLMGHSNVTEYDRISMWLEQVYMIRKSHVIEPTILPIIHTSSILTEYDHISVWVKQQLFMIRKCHYHRSNYPDYGTKQRYRIWWHINISKTTIVHD